MDNSNWLSPADKEALEESRRQRQPHRRETIPNRSTMRDKGIGVTRHTGQGWQGARLGTRARKTPASIHSTIAIVMMRDGKKVKMLVPRDSYVPVRQS
jgi:hypothetical protein